MKSILLAASAVVLLSATPGAYAQSSGPTYDNSIHQSAGDRDSRGYPKYNQEGRGAVRATRRHREMGSSRMNRSATTGAGPYYENSIHQSAGDRDSRGYPKYYKGD
jgi:hypothetical protein